MSKFRITIEEVHEDGTVTPFTDENGTPACITDREGFLLVAANDIGEELECASILHGMSIVDIATAISGHPILLKAAKLAALKDLIEAKGAKNNSEDEDAAD